MHFATCRVLRGLGGMPSTESPCGKAEDCTPPPPPPPASGAL